MSRSGQSFRVFAGVLLASLTICLLSALGMEAAGLMLTPVGGLQTESHDLRPIETLQPDSQESLPGTTITIWFLDGPRYFDSPSIYARELVRGKTAGGELAYRIEFDEAGFNQYLSYWFLPPGELLDPYVRALRNPHVDLRNGGLTLLADMAISGTWQPVGLIFDLDESGTQLDFRGIQVGGGVLSAAPDSLFDDKRGAGLEMLVNRALRELTFLDDSGVELTISQISIDESQAVVLAQESR